MTGKFINFDLPYVKNGQSVSFHDQALAILQEANRLLTNPAIPGVAITYSANYSQTLAIKKTYASGGWNNQTNGGNQATVMFDMENYLGSTYTNLQGKMHIAPITTMGVGLIPNWDTSASVQAAIVTTDLDAIMQYLNEGWCVLGWQNQHTIGTSHPYAVGGGFAQHLMPTTSDLIQHRLIGFSNTYV